MKFPTMKNTVVIAEVKQWQRFQGERIDTIVERRPFKQPGSVTPPDFRRFFTVIRVPVAIKRYADGREQLLFSDPTHLDLDGDTPAAAFASLDMLIAEATEKVKRESQEKLKKAVQPKLALPSSPEAQAVMAAANRRQQP